MNIQIPKNSLLLILEEEVVKTKGLNVNTSSNTKYRVGKIIQSNHPNYISGTIYFDFGKAIHLDKDVVEVVFQSKYIGCEFILVEDSNILININ